MSESLNKLMQILKDKGEITDEEIKKITDEFGELSAEEHIEFSLARVKDKTKITMEQYLEATKVLDTATEGSPEYVAAEKIVEEFESSN